MDNSLSEPLALQMEHRQLIAGVEPVVRDEVTAATAAEHWDFVSDERDRPLLVLTLSDSFGGKATAQFAPEELQHEQHFRQRLRQLHGTMLRVGDWCHSKLPALYSDVKRWISEFDPNCFCHETVVAINERPSGVYDAPALDIWREAQVVNVRPVGIWVVAAHGRVDLVGRTDRYILTLQDDQWFVVQPTSRIGQEPLTADVFRGIFEALLA